MLFGDSDVFLQLTTTDHDFCFYYLADE